MKYFHSGLHNEQGFALITAIMMLFAATVMGLMVMNSSEIEILLSGAQQRYENNFNTTDGAISVKTNEAALLAVSDPTSTIAQILSPSSSHDANFDPYNDMDADNADDEYTVNLTTTPELWPMDNLLQSNLAGNNLFDYHYRVVYRGLGNPVAGTEGSTLRHQISAQSGALIEVGSIMPDATGVGDTPDLADD